MHKITGFLILSISLLTTALIIMLAQISRHVDKIDNIFWNSISKQIPFTIYLLLAIPYIISLLLIFYDKLDKSGSNEKK